MLSKLRYFRNQPPQKRVPGTAPDVTLLAATMGGPGTIPEIVASGTLGACFLLSQRDGRKFAKTNSTPEGRAALEKEAAIMAHLYGRQLHVERILVSSPGETRLWLVMDALSYPAQPGDPDTLLGLIRTFSTPLETMDRTLVPADDNFGLLVSEGVSALDFLASGGHLSNALRQWTMAQLTLLQQWLPHFPASICHGDLGPRNIMATGNGLVAIDWEDAFWGFEGYDYLYWLTFMDQRKYYSPTMFGRTPWGKEVEIAVLALIVILKCKLSVLAGSVSVNRLSFDQRLREIATFG